MWAVCKYHAILCKGLECPWFLVSVRVSEPIPSGFGGMTAFTSILMSYLQLCILFPKENLEME